MMTKKKYFPSIPEAIKIRYVILFCMAITISGRLAAQTQKLKMPNGQETFFSGMNVAWNNYGNDVGDAPVDKNHFDKLLNEIKAAGGNTVRWWLFTNASVAPKFNNGLVSGLGANSINNIKTVLDLARDKNMAIVLCLFSFDLLQTGQSGVNAYNNKQMLTTDAGVKACIDNCIVPLVTAIGPHPSILCWEILNEPEGMLQNGGWTNERISMYDIQRFVNRTAGAIHRAVPNVYVSNGSKSFYYLSGKIGKNYYTNAELKNAGGDQDGYLDFYMVHYYDNEGAPGTQHSPFHHDASYWQMDKPIIVAEFGAKGYNNNFYMSPTECYKQIINRGYVGALSWTYTNHDGFGGLPDATPGLNYLKNNYPGNLVFSVEPPVNYGTNVALNKPVEVSSVEANSAMTGSNINDGNSSTRWASSNADNQSVIIDLLANYAISTIQIKWEAAFAKGYKVEVSQDKTNWNTVFQTSAGDGGNDVLKDLTVGGRYVRLIMNSKGTIWAYSIYELEVYGTLDLGANIALNKKVTASSVETGSANTAAMLTDGNSSTRWSSLYSDLQNVVIDLSDVYNISNIVLNWEAAYGKAYKVEVSSDLTNWVTVFQTTDGKGGKELLSNINESGRYIRLNLTQRATQWGYSLYEIEVYGTSADVITGSENVDNANSVIVYPNPTTDWIKSSRIAQMELSDLNGLILFQGYSNEINVSNLPSGLYLLRLNVGSSSKVIKIKKS